ncbi:HARBI1 family protein [Catenulispora pinisilvae]|uniref:HARBI1 family protein n=1 Tax=Catenulispora pinisilvae TaxID=2705253 RepID=UPI0018921559|nr:transposase family protein [Catenulispora pinisilvae]
MVTYTAVLDVREETVFFLARLLCLRRAELGTRRGRRALGCYRQAVLVLRWFLDGTRIAQLACDNGIGKSTAYRALHEGIDALAAAAPGLPEAIAAAKAAGHTHLNLDGTVIRIDRCAAPGPNGADLWWSGKHKHHGGNLQVLSDTDGWPLWISAVRPGREHDTTCAKAAAGLMSALEQAAAEQMPTLTDLGYEGLAGPALRMPIKKLKGVELKEDQRQYNLLVRGVHAIAERANSLLKTTFKALRRVSVCPWRIGAIAKAAIVLLHLEYGRPLPARHTA